MWVYISVFVCLFILYYVLANERHMVAFMIDKSIGRRIKQRREELGYTQEQFAEKTGLTINYISTIERGVSFPRYDKLILILNTLQTSADAIFYDVLDYACEAKSSVLSEMIGKLPVEEQKRILNTVEFMIKQAEN